MLKTVYRRHEMVFRFALRHLRYNSVQVVTVLIGKEDRLYVGIIDEYMLHAVVLFVLAGQFMLLDLAGHIVLHRCRYNQSVLRTGAIDCQPMTRRNSLSINIIEFFLVLLEPAVATEEIKLLPCCRIDLRIMLVRAFRKIDFRLDNMVQRHRVAFGFPTSFLRRQDIIRAGVDFLYQLLRRTNTSKRLDNHTTYGLFLNRSLCRGFLAHRAGAVEGSVRLYDERRSLYFSFYISARA